MEIKLLKKLFEEGVLTAARIVPVPMEKDKFFLVLDRASGAEDRVTKARDDKDKIYRRYTGAVLDAKEIGFKKVNISFN